MHVKPQEGLQVFDPVRRDNLPAEGRVVPRDPYWVRRVRDKDVVEFTPETEAETTETRQPSKKKGA